ncbi:MAG: c-type cytochrome [Burkholderiaceae bacterium]|nr:MAG: c-type cytochrome [Burkholderiaceae bacterium]
MKTLRAVVAATCILLSGQALASMELAKAKNCLICHDVAAKKIGPAYKDVAAKYANDKGAAARLAAKIRAGGTGVWNMGVMPANPQVNEAEALTLAKWVLSQK